MKIGNIKFSDMSTGLTPEDWQRNSMINEVLRNMKDGAPHYTMSTGNLLVVAIRYDTEIRIIVTNNYMDCSVYNRDPEVELKNLVAYT